MFKYRSISDPKDDAANLRDYLYELFLLLWDADAAKKAGIGQAFLEEFQKEIRANSEWNEAKAKSIQERALGFPLVPRIYAKTYRSLPYRNLTVTLWSSNISKATEICSSLHRYLGARSARRMANGASSAFDGSVPEGSPGRKLPTCAAVLTIALVRIHTRRLCQPW